MIEGGRGGVGFDLPTTTTLHLRPILLLAASSGLLRLWPLPQHLAGLRFLTIRRVPGDRCRLRYPYAGNSAEETKM